MDTSVLAFGKGIKPPLPLKSSLHPQAARGPAEWPVENAKDFSSSEAGRRKTGSCTTVRSPWAVCPHLYTLLSQFTGLGTLHYPECNGKIKFTLPEAKTCDILQLNLRHRHQTETREMAATSDYCHLGSSPLPGRPHWQKDQVSRSGQAHVGLIHNSLQNLTTPPKPVPPGWVLGLSRARHTDISVSQLQNKDST